MMLVGVFTMNYALGCELLNFGALIAFMGVNLSALLHYYIRGDRRRFWNFLSPALGFVVCAYLWWSLGRTAHIAGTIWLLTGILYGACRTRGFRRPMEYAELDSDNSKK
jgi:putrescine importer